MIATIPWDLSTYILRGANINDVAISLVGGEDSTHLRNFSYVEDEKYFYMRWGSVPGHIIKLIDFDKNTGISDYPNDCYELRLIIHGDTSVQL